jgi:hypothetical protein
MNCSPPISKIRLPSVNLEKPPLKVLTAKRWEVCRLLNWRSAVWSVNVFFLLMTLIVAYLPYDSAASRRGLVRYLAQFTLAEEKNLATYWEGYVCCWYQSLRSNGFSRVTRSEKRKNKVG